jgi:serine/threonine-protein kinase
LGRYEVEALIGAGGMGEVYRARDSRLQRAVALKVLPREVSSDPERLARLEREARLLAALNHPNIATIHGLEEGEGTRFLVLELVEGQTMAERLKRGPIPLEETLDLGRQIAEGLEAAHERGIIHRDLKPANVKLTLEGKVKILDFGLAKVPRGELAAGDAMPGATLTGQLSQPGAILGTAAYMSPEQASGKPVDKRTDVWAFGCVVYECLTGGKAFPGGTITEILAAVLKSEPDWQALPANTPGKIKDLLHRCLQKDPRNRLHDIADARIELHEHEQLPSEPLRASPPPSRRALIAAALCLGLLIGAFVMRYFQPASSPVSLPVVRFPIRVEPGHWLDGWRWSPPYGVARPTRTAMAISSDGRFMVYSAVKEKPGEQDKSRLYVRRFDQLEAKPIAGAEGGSCPVLSPDDRWIGFWMDGKLMKVPVEGGVAAALCDVPMPFGLSWGVDNQIIFAPGCDFGLSRISAAGGKTETLTTPDRSKEEYSHRLPCCLPGGKGVLFTIMRHAWDTQPRVAVLELATRKWRVLLENAADARYINSDRLVFLQQGTLLVVPFDLDRLQVTGQPVPVEANIAQALNNSSGYWSVAAGQYSVSASGSLVYASGGLLPDMQNSLVWVDQQGKAEPVAKFKGPFACPRLSPDGQQIAYQTAGFEWGIWVYDVKRGTVTKLTSDGVGGNPLWSPDGRHVAFWWLKTGVANLYWQAADGSSPMERLATSDSEQYAGSWSTNGEMLALVGYQLGISADISLLNIRERKVTPYLNSRFDEMCPDFSADGKWLAYTSHESGRAEVYVQPFPAGGGRWQISNEGGWQSLWARDGRRLFYRWADQVWVVDIQTTPGFAASKPKLLFEQPGFAQGGEIRGWDISPDGERFLMVKLEERKPQPLTEMVLVQNWIEEVRRLVPTKKSGRSD